MKNSNDRAEVSKSDILRHIIDSCDKDVLYLAKIIFGVFGKHAVSIGIRIAVYIFVVIPFFNQVIGLSKGVSALALLGCILVYYSLRGIYAKMKDEVEDGSV